MFSYELLIEISVLFICYLFLILSLYFSLKFQGPQGPQGPKGNQGPQGQTTITNDEFIIRMNYIKITEIPSTGISKTNIFYEYSFSGNVVLQIDKNNWVDGSFLKFYLKNSNSYSLTLQTDDSDPLYFIDEKGQKQILNLSFTIIDNIIITMIKNQDLFFYWFASDK